MSYSLNQASSSRLSGGVSFRLSDGLDRVHGSGYRGPGISISSKSNGSGFGVSTGFGHGAGSSFSASFSAGGDGGLPCGNEKYTMQNLNDRLANYLDNVRSLEAVNNDLEAKIKDWYTKQGTLAVREQNFAGYYTTIDELRDKISVATLNNSKVISEIDNARLAAKDFTLKYENELSMRLGMDNDITGLRHVLNELAMAQSDLELQIEGLKDELIYLKNNHEEEVTDNKKQSFGTVNVELDAAPGVDLLKTLNDLREEYEHIAEKNRTEAEALFLGQVESLQKYAASNTQQIQTNKSESTKLRRSLQGFEIELQSLLTAKASLEASVAETERRYAAQLSQRQFIVNSIEGQIVDLQSDLERQDQEYKALLNIKTRLEQEIAMYHQLLEGEGGKVASGEFKLESSTGTTLKVQEIIKEKVSGMVISATTLNRY